MVVVAFVQRLQDRQQRQQIEADMRAACDNLSPEAKVRRRMLLASAAVPSPAFRPPSVTDASQPLLL